MGFPCSASIQRRSAAEREGVVLWLHDEWSTVGLFGTLALPGLLCLLLQVDVAGGGVVG